MNFVAVLILLTQIIRWILHIHTHPIWYTSSISTCHDDTNGVSSDRFVTGPISLVCIRSVQNLLKQHLCFEFLTWLESGAHSWGQQLVADAS